MVLNGSFLSKPGMGKRIMASSEIPTALAALRAVSNKGAQVNIPLAPEDRS